MSQGKLIVLEGGDGAGKSTQTDLVKKYLEEKNLSYKYFHFPMYGHNDFSEIIAKFLRGDFGKADKVDPYFVANIYAMDRYLFLPELEKHLEENDVVLLDRYVFSNLAYQGAKYVNDSLKSSKIKQWILDFEFEFLKLPYPDLSLFLNVPIHIVKERLENKRDGDDRRYLNGKSDIHEEDLELQKRVNHNYLSVMKNSENSEIIECGLQYGKDGKIFWNIYTPEEIFDSIETKLDDLLFPIEKYNTPKVGEIEV